MKIDYALLLLKPSGFTGRLCIRECASKVTDNLNKNYSVTGMVKPGSLFVQWQTLL